MPTLCSSAIFVRHLEYAVTQNMCAVQWQLCNNANQTAQANIPPKTRSFIRFAIMVMSLAIIFTLSLLELAVGVLKAEVAVRLAKTLYDAINLASLGVLVKTGLCIAVNVLPVWNAKGKDRSDLEKAAAASFDSI